MRFIKKAVLTGALAMSVCLISGTKVSAAETFFKTETFELKEASFVEDIQYILTKGNHLSSGSVQLHDKGGRVLAISGSTNCHMVCDKVTCNLYLEQMDDNGNWYTYKYWQCSATNVYSYSPTKTTSVAGGHWYRARGAHIANKGGSMESVSTATNGIWVP